jgi:lysine 6-dehydrogenase
MKILVLGAGKLGTAAAFDLLRYEDIEQVAVADTDAELLDSLQARLEHRRLETHALDNSDGDAMIEALRPYDACVNALGYHTSLEVTRAAIEAGTHLCDLGGGGEVVAQQLKLDTAAFERGITVIPDCGLAPGLTTILAAHGSRRLDEIGAIQIRVGELPLRPVRPLRLVFPYPMSLLLERYSQRALVIRDGMRLSVEPLTEVEAIEFPDPFGNLEAFNTAGGLSTLAGTFAGKVRNLDFKSIRYPGHCATIRPLFDLGFFADEPVAVGDAELRPRDVTARILQNLLEPDGEDAVLMRVTVVGAKFGGRRRLEYELVDRADAAGGLGAAARCAGFTASAVAQMLGAGKIDRHGVVPPERCVPAEELIQQLRQRGLEVVQRQS